MTANVDPHRQRARPEGGFPARQTPHFEAVKGIDFDIPANSTVALVGESGSGKSVTALAMLGLLPTENSTVDPGSEIRYGGRDLLALAPANCGRSEGPISR